MVLYAILVRLNCIKLQTIFPTFREPSNCAKTPNSVDKKPNERKRSFCLTDCTCMWLGHIMLHPIDKYSDRELVCLSPNGSNYQQSEFAKELINMIGFEFRVFD